MPCRKYPIGSSCVGPHGKDAQLPSDRNHRYDVAGLTSIAQLAALNPEEAVKIRPKRRAARHHSSVEDDGRDIPRGANPNRKADGLGTRLARRFAERGLDFDIPEIRCEAVHPISFKE